MLSQDCNCNWLDQVQPVLQHAGYRVWMARSPGSLRAYYPEIFGWMHADMWVSPLARDLALVFLPWCDLETLRYLHSVCYTLIETDRGEMESVAPAHLTTTERRLAVMPSGAPKTRRRVEEHHVEVSDVAYDEVIGCSGGIRRTTMQLVRDTGPRVFAE